MTRKNIDTFSCTFSINTTISVKIELKFKSDSPPPPPQGVYLAIHPDDPPIKLLGLPRMVSTQEDLRRIVGNGKIVSYGICEKTFWTFGDDFL